MKNTSKRVSLFVAIGFAAAALGACMSDMNSGTTDTSGGMSSSSMSSTMSGSGM